MPWSLVRIQDAPPFNSGSVAMMDADTKSMYDFLEKEVVRLHFRWGIYRQLFGTSAENIDVLNGVAPDFFAVVQDSLWHQTLLTIGKMTDSARTAGHENASLDALVERLTDPTDAQFRDELRGDLIDLHVSCSAIEQHRNKRLAHFDKVEFLDTSGQTQGISRADVETILQKIRSILNKIKSRFEGSQVVYERLIARPHGTELIRYFQECGTAREVTERRVERINAQKMNQ